MSFSIRYVKYVFAVLLVFLVACASHQPQQQPGVDKAEQQPHGQQQEQEEKSGSKQRDAEPSKMRNAGSGNRTSTAQSLPRFDVQANKVPARQFFLGLVEDTSHSLTIHPDVEGRISLQMKDVTLPQVLQEVQSLYGYPFRKTDVGYRVLPAGVITRTFHVNYLDISRSGGSSTQVRSGSISQNDDNNNANSVTSTNIDTDSKTAFWSELETTLSSMLDEDGKSRVIIQPQAGLVVVSAVPGEMQQVKKYLQTMQESIQKQVVLEAKIVEVGLSQGHQTGINWSGLLAESDDSGAVVSQSGGGTVISEGSSPSSGSPVDLAPDDPDLSTGRVANAFGGVFSAALNIRNFTAFIELLQEQGDVDVLSSPRVATTNNQKAVIKVGTDQFFVTDVSTQNSNYGSEDNRDTQINDVTLDPFFSGISLDVTPQISPGDMVTMHIHPSVSDVTEVKKSLQLGGDQVTLPLAQSEVRESDSIVKARDGQIVIIGGLMKTETSTDEASIPVLGDIPWLGYLFRHEKKMQSKSELVILLRPRVIGYNQNVESRIPEQEGLDTDNFGKRWQGN
ncbi:MAG: pilus (MSHA type) biogenesis protein MshL [Thermodesulfobacteriota bacterium]